MYCLASGPCSVVILIIDLCNAMDYYNTSTYCVCVDYYVLLMDYYNIY